MRPLAARLLGPLFPFLGRRDAFMFGLRFRARPDVFHPGLYFSSSLLAKFLLAMDIKSLKVLDMGTGCGLIGVIAAVRGATVLALDINPSAVSLAVKNAKLNGVSNRMEVRHSDLFSAVSPGAHFDLVAFNPPFHPAQARNAYGSAWSAGEGYAVVREFLSQVNGFLSPGGSAVVIYTSDMDLGLLSRTATEHRLAVVRETVVPHLFEEFHLLELRPVAPPAS